MSTTNQTIPAQHPFVDAMNQTNTAAVNLLRERPSGWLSYDGQRIYVIERSNLVVHNTLTNRTTTFAADIPIDCPLLFCAHEFNTRTLMITKSNTHHDDIRLLFLDFQRNEFTTNFVPLNELLRPQRPYASPISAINRRHHSPYYSSWHQNSNVHRRTQQCAQRIANKNAANRSYTANQLPPTVCEPPMRRTLRWCLDQRAHHIERANTVRSDDKCEILDLIEFLLVESKRRRNRKTFYLELQSNNSEGA